MQKLKRRQKLKTKSKKMRMIQQKGGAVYVSTDGTFRATDDSSIILSHLFANCAGLHLLSDETYTSFVFSMRLRQPSDATIQLRSLVIDNYGNPLPQSSSKHRDRNAEAGLIMLECCIKVSLVMRDDSKKMPSLEYNGNKKGAEVSENIIAEAEAQSYMYQASICGTGVAGVFIPDKITNRLMLPDEFTKYYSTIQPDVISPESRAALEWIVATARYSNYDIHVFCMELIGSIRDEGGFMTFEEFELQRKAAAPTISYPPDTVAVACKVAAAVLSTFSKSSFWSYDQHKNNTMTNGAYVYLLDFGRVYHILRDEGILNRYFEELLMESMYVRKPLAIFFGVSDHLKTDEIRARFHLIYDKYKNPDRGIIAQYLTLNPEVPDDIFRVSSNIFELLSFIALTDSLTKMYKYKSVNALQCSGYMQYVFHTASPFNSGMPSNGNMIPGYMMFLTQFASTLEIFNAVSLQRGANIIGHVLENMTTIAMLLQDALIPCAEMGPPLETGEVRLPPPVMVLSPETLLHQDALARDEKARSQYLDVWNRPLTAEQIAVFQQQREAEAALSAWAAEAGSSHGGYGGGKLARIASKSKRKRVVVKGRTSRRRRRSYRNSRWRRV
jgi:hypothetical protein